MSMAYAFTFCFVYMFIGFIVSNLVVKYLSSNKYDIVDVLFVCFLAILWPLLVPYVFLIAVHSGLCWAKTRTERDKFRHFKGHGYVSIDGTFHRPKLGSHT